YLMETWSAGQILADQMGVLPQTHYNIGRLDQEAGAGYYFDLFTAYAGNAPSAGFDSTNINVVYRYTDLSSYFDSGIEHGVIEQLQPTNLVAASTVKMLEIANAYGERIFLANSDNWSWNQYDLYNYLGDDIATFDYLISRGDTLLLPEY